MSLAIDVWSDIACPWCWIGKRRLERALALSHRDDAIVTWRAFELDPTAPPVRDASQSYAERLARKYQTSVLQAQSMIDRMTRVGADEGLDFRFDRIRSGNTFDAHRVLHLAHRHGRQNELKERLLRAYFSEGRAIGERSVLAELAEEVGLDRVEVARVLETDELGAEVEADETQARLLGVSGVPFFVFEGRVGVSGAQSPEVLAGVIEQAKDPGATEGVACTPTGCDA